MIAVILNSGMGKRLGEFTENKPKCLIPLHNNETLFYRQVTLLKKAGIKKYVITTGYMKNKLMDYAEQKFPDTDFTFVDNGRYETTNYIVSLNNVGDSIDDDFLLLHGDLYFDYSVLEILMQAQKSSVVVDLTLPLPQKDFRARIQDERVTQISTDLHGGTIVACQPFYKILKNDWPLWKDSITRFCAAGKTNVYAEDAFNGISDKMFLGFTDIQGRTCQEVDTPEDWEKIKLLNPEDTTK